ncbi:hypothetical protein OPKNFCMD_2881 [Methylobacterium crusticola]|uniref:Uncharacterized protein n=1 Tax=Methylobacterium crusticola TaxID=1697972 RepID=A0ABQ4QY43_9HYPH|nr:hypothetical protein [Methylobacterium crusticola]GJD50144.1 hypothetical protein OPKNFCMD_2881 [Methylobacterium crusticola]
MGTQEIEDRLVALETLATQLIRTLHRAKVLGGDEVRVLLDSVEELMIGTPGAAFAAQQLAGSADPDAAGLPVLDESPEAHVCDAFRKMLYRTDLSS